MRPLVTTLCTLALLAVGACARPRYPAPRALTGTCEGACDYYLACKQRDEESALAQCVVECREIFSDTDSLAELESLACEDVVAFVEGSSGRGPGAGPY